MALGVFGIGLLGAFRWTLVPIAVHERLVDTGYQDGTSERMRTLDLESGRRIVVDRSLIERAGGRDALRGVSVSKERGQKTLTVSGREVDLRLPSEFWRTMAALVFLIGLASWRRVRGQAPAR